MSEELAETRQEQREKKLESKKQHTRQHGRNLARLYKEAILKRINKLRKDKEKGHQIDRS